MNQGLIGAGWMLSSAIVFATMTAVIKVIAWEATTWQITFYRFILGGAGMYLLARLFGRGIWGNHRRILLIRGLVGTIAFLCQVQAIRTLPLSVAMVLFFLFPVFAALVSPLVNHESASRGDWVFIGGAVMGAVLILWPDDLSAGLDFNYVYAVAAAFFAGLATSLVRRLRQDNNPFTLYFYLCLVGVLACLGPVFYQPAPVVPQGSLLGALVLIACLSMVSQLAMNQGFMYLSAPKGGVVLMTQVALSGAAGVIFFGETLGWRLLSGAALILGSSLWLSIRPTVRPVAEL